MTIAPIHPFPARMDPIEALRRLPKPGAHPLLVLDPMMGSGTIPVMAGIRGHSAIGFDVDPLALLIARTTARVLTVSALKAASSRVVEHARLGASARSRHPDSATQAF